MKKAQNAWNCTHTHTHTHINLLNKKSMKNALLIIPKTDQFII